MADTLAPGADSPLPRVSAMIGAVLAVWLLPAVLALVDWYAVAREDRRTETWAKPATLVALIAVALILGGTDSSAGLWLVVALVLGLIGDVLLLGDSDTRFRLGLASFLVGHLAFIVSFVQLGLDQPSWLWIAWLVLFVCLIATRRVVPATFLRGGRALALPVAVYTVVIGAMLIVAFDTGEPLIAVGAAIFAASDSILAVNRFVSPRPWAPVAVMVTYHVGQALIVAGLLAATT